MAQGRSADVVRYGDTYESITVANTVKTLTAATAARANRVFITAETADMRFRYDGGDPSTTAGHLLSDGDTLTLYGTQNLKNFKAIRTGSVSGVLKVTYEV